MKYIYFDCFAGFDVQMALGALADMAKDSVTAENAARALLESASLSAIEVKRQGMEAVLAGFSYAVSQKTEPADIIENAVFHDDIKSRLKLWLKLRTNDGKITDSKSDILNELLYVAACLNLIKDAGAKAIYVSGIMQGVGVNTDNDEISVIPSPYTDFLCKMADIHIREFTWDKELLTPGGAALLYVIGAEYMPQKAHNVVKSGYGAGAEELEIPNILRAILADDSDDELSLNFETVISEMYTEFGAFAEASENI